MRAYRVEGGGHLRLGGTAQQAKELRDGLMEQTGKRKKDISITEVEIPTAKAEFLDFLNSLIAEVETAPEE